MKSIWFAVVLLAVAAGLGSTHSAAQNPSPGQVNLPGYGGPGMAASQTMDLATAQKMVAAAEAAAVAMNQHVAICVMDTNGDVVLLERMNGVGHIPVITSEGKARSALLFGQSTGEISDRIRSKKPVTATIHALPVGDGGEITLMHGGLPVVKNGSLIGAIGVGGSASTTDEKFAQAGVEAAAGK